MHLTPVPVCRQLEDQLILPMSVWSFLASNREGTLRILELFIMVSEQTQLFSLLTYITPIEANRSFFQIEQKDNRREALLFPGRLLLAENLRKSKNFRHGKILDVKSSKSFSLYG